MSITFDDSFRQVIPRWLPYKSACMLGLLRSIKKKDNTIVSNNSFDKSKSAWMGEGNLFTAVDLLGEAIFLRKYDSDEAFKAAKLILSYKQSTVRFIKEIAQHYLEGEQISKNNFINSKESNYERIQISRLRRLVHEYPLNPIAWSDLSFFHAILGNEIKSRNAMLVAIKLGKGNRFILRSAARCFLHINEPDIAIEVLKKSDLCGFDPWINSAEIAIADRINRKSYCIDSAKNLLRNDNLSPYSKSELAACLGTIELCNGAVKKGKLHFKEALLDPSENALAQIQWMLSRVNILSASQFSQTIPASYEAQARCHFRNENYLESISAAEKWGCFQPFSSMPLILASYIASVCLDDDKKNISIIQKSLPIHRQNHTLMNNLSFSLIRVGQLDAAKKILDSILQKNLNDHEKYVISATQGLHFFRSGNAKMGQECYKNAIRGFEKTKDFKSAAIASYYWALEEKRLRSSCATERISDAKKRILKFNVIELQKKIISL